MFVCVCRLEPALVDMPAFSGSSDIPEVLIPRDGNVADLSRGKRVLDWSGLSFLDMSVEAIWRGADAGVLVGLTVSLDLSG